MIQDMSAIGEFVKDFGGWGFFALTVWFGGRALLTVLRDGFQFLGGKIEDVGAKVDELRECVTKQGDRLERLEEQVGSKSSHRKAQ